MLNISIEACEREKIGMKEFQASVSLKKIYGDSSPRLNFYEENIWTAN